MAEEALYHSFGQHSTKNPQVYNFNRKKDPISNNNGTHYILQEVTEDLPTEIGVPFAPNK